MTIRFRKGETLEAVELHPLSSKAQDLITRYRNKEKNAPLTSIYDRPSEKKREAFESIREEMARVKGEDLRATGGNSYLFSCGYMAKDTRKRLWLIYHTASLRYAIKLN